MTKPRFFRLPASGDRLLPLRWSGATPLAFLGLLFATLAWAGEPAAVVDAPPRATQKPYSPADGQVVEVSPPPFLWVPAKPGSTYVLQLSRSQSFDAADTQTFDGLQRSVFVPAQPLPAGAWYWRYGVATEQGPVYGRPRPFEVPEDARPFPFPDWDEAVRRVPLQRPRLFFPGQRLEQIRGWAAGELKPAIDSLVASCTREIGQELVAEPGYRPKGADYGPWAVNVMRTTRPPMDVMERCALAYLITGNEPLGQEAKRRLQHFFAWDPEGPTSFFAYDEPPMWMMMRGTRAYDWTYDLFTPAEREAIEAAMRVRAAQFLKHLQRLPFESNPYDSHAGRLPGFLGECALSFIHEWPEARQWLEYATLLYYTSYPAWGGDDGGWQEGPGYWSAYMQFALHYVLALREATGVDLAQKPFFRNTPYYGLYTATPYHQHSPFGDGQTGSPRGTGHVMYVFSTLTQNPYARWHAEASGVRIGADVLSLAAYDPALQDTLGAHQSSNGKPQVRAKPFGRRQSPSYLKRPELAGGSKPNRRGPAGHTKPVPRAPTRRGRFLRPRCGRSGNVPAPGCACANARITAGCETRRRPFPGARRCPAATAAGRPSTRRRGPRCPSSAEPDPAFVGRPVRPARRAGQSP